MILCFFNVFCYTGHLHFRANMNYFDDNVDTRRMGIIYVKIVPSKMQPSYAFIIENKMDQIQEKCKRIGKHKGSLLFRQLNVAAVALLDVGSSTPSLDGSGVLINSGMCRKNNHCFTTDVGAMGVGGSGVWGVEE